MCITIKERRSCALCSLKHLAQARVLLNESRNGYPEHFWFSQGHLAEAEDELVTSYPRLARHVRYYRKRLERQPDFDFPFRKLVLVISVKTGYDVRLFLKQGET